MTNKICPMYKAALLTVERWDEALKAGLAQCDGAACGWWVEEKKCLRISGANPVGCLGGENIRRLP